MSAVRAVAGRLLWSDRPRSFFQSRSVPAAHQLIPLSASTHAGTLTWFVGGPEGSRRHAVLRGS